MATATKRATRPAPSLNDLLGKMDKKTKEAPAIRKVPDRPNLKLDEEASEELSRLVGYHAVYDKIVTLHDNQKQEVNELLYDVWTGFVFDNQCVPKSNPKVESSDKKQGTSCSAIFQVQQRFKVEIPDEIPKEQSAEDVVIDLLIKVGIVEETAMEIVGRELNFEPKRGVKNLSDIMKLDGGEDAVRRFLTMCYTDAEKEGGVIEVEPLTDKDRDLLFYKSAHVTVADGFFDRLPTYVKNVEQLRGVLKVIRPTHIYPSHMKLVAKDEFGTLKQIAAEMLGIELKVEK